MSKKLHWAAGSGRDLRLSLTRDEASSGSHPGDCAADVEALSRLPHVASQLAEWSAEDLAAELGEYGAWEDDQLSDHAANVQRMLWLACGDIVEGNL